MNAQARSRLTSAARRYLAAAPWKLVGDDYIFGLDDRTSERYGCASVLGGAGLEFGLDVNLGEQGFTLLQKLLDDEIDFSTFKAKASSVTFSITDVAPASRAFRRAEPMLIDKKKVTAPKRGYLTAWRLVPGQEMRPLDAEEAVFLARCLEAVAELAETSRLGKDPLKDGTRTLIFDLTEADGRVTIQKSYRQLAEVEIAHPRTKLAPELLERLRKRPRVEGPYFLSIFSPPATVQGGILWVALMLDETGRAILAHADLSFEAAALAVFEAFDGKTTLEHAAGVPREVWTDALPTFDALDDAMRYLEVRFIAKTEIPELERAKRSLSDHMTRR